ncbi:uncharacterized protein LOC112199678 [Rosa chinensis]|uniref:uncharacterized protein LOC112199678 n=1 Tax=Rosa chinensis TaxID=74649 RepID=UPI000D087E50|nr:uncharacterized protein LOC112199678 [Rosa chinensis]
MRLEQRWERIFDKYNEGKSNNANAVFVDAFVQREAVFVAGSEAIWDNHERVDNAGDGFMWFKSSDGVGGERSVGLSMKIVERMKWEQERVGWLAGDERKVRVERVEEFGGRGTNGNDKLINFHGLGILKRCREAISISKSDRGKVIIKDIVVTVDNKKMNNRSTETQLLWDMLLMVNLTGKERTEGVGEAVFGCRIQLL